MINSSPVLSIPNSVRFLSELLAARQDFGERILTQRLVIYQRWVKTFSPAGMDARIKENNKKLLLARLSSTINMSLEAPDRECVAEGGGSEPCGPPAGDAGGDGDKP
jgi:hypothetical protein